MEDFVFAGEDASNRGDLSEATEHYRRALELDPQSARAYSGLGYVYLRVQQARDALTYFEDALKRAPDDSWAIYGAALSYMQLGEQDAALRLAHELMEHTNTSFHANGHYIAGCIFYEQGLFEDAVRELLQSVWEVTSRKLRRRAQLLLADVYIELSQPDEALRWLQRVREDQWTRSIEEQIGRLHLELGHYPDAEASFRAILRKYSRDTRAITSMGQLYLRQQNHDRAIARFEEVLSQTPNYYAAIEGLVSAYAQRGELSKAASLLERLDQASQLPEPRQERRIRALVRERERRDAELTRIRNMASLNVMATGLAHELRQPLSVIRLAADNARAALELGQTENLAATLQTMESHIDKVDNMIEVLRSIASSEPRHARPVRLGEVVQQAVELFGTQLGSRGIEVTTSDLDCMVLTDAVAILQVLVILIGNARDAMADTSKKELRVWALTREGRVYLHVKDTGYGMSADVRRRAMDPFFTTKTGQAMGLGLYLAHHIMDKLNGQLAIKESEPGRGTTIEVMVSEADGAEGEKATA